MKEFDLIVAGGGIAGCAAALAAARRGKSVALLEKTVWPGGLATSGLIYVYLPICDGCGRQVCFGITRELLSAGHAYGPGDIPGHWRDSAPKALNERLYTIFSPASMVLALDELLEKAGVSVWFDTLLTGVQREGRRITAVDVENKSGHLTLQAAYFIDATGDADLVRRSGEEFFAEENQLASWAIEYDAMAKKGPRNLADGLACAVIHRAEEPGVFRGISGESVSRMIRESRRELRKRYQEAYASGVSRNDRFPLLLPMQANFRRTFSIRGRLTLTPENALERFEDSVGLFGNWFSPGPVHELPYRTLLSPGLDNVWAAGRCISVTGETCELTRVIPVAAMTGEIAGTAAALACDRKLSSSELDCEALRRELRRNEFRFHKEEL